MLRVLAQREVAGGAQYIRPFSKIPASMMHRIEDIEDVGQELRGCILLGFTRDAYHLVSYTTGPMAAADGQPGLSLQLWAFAPGSRLRRVWSVPLFRTPAYLAALGEEHGVFDPEPEMSLTVAEAPDSTLLVVHGRPADGAALTSHDPLPNHLTLIPGPLLSAAIQLRAAHLCYHSLHPHPAWNPYIALHPLAPSSSCGPPLLAVALFSVDALRYVHARARVRQVGADTGAAASSGSGGLPNQAHVPGSQGGSRSSTEGPGDWWESLVMRWSTVDRCAGSGAGAMTAGRPGPGTPGSGGSCVPPRQPPGHECGCIAEVELSVPAQQLDVEALACAALAQHGLPPRALCDYVAVPVTQGYWLGREGVLVLALLQLQQGGQPDDGREGGAPDAGQPRSACLLLHAAAASGEAGVVEVLEPPYPWQGDLTSDMVQQLALAGVGFCRAAGYFADFLRSRHALPASHVCLPTALTNQSVLVGGRSLRYVAHPWLPAAVLAGTWDRSPSMRPAVLGL